MEVTNIVDFGGRNGVMVALTEVLRKGTQQFIVSALEEELEGDMSQFEAKRTATGHAAVGRDQIRYRKGLQFVHQT